MTVQTSNAPAWLTARPIAHRGLHAKAEARVENSLAACRAAIARNYAIECDIQRSGDGEAMVFHDFTLERLTAAGTAALGDLPSAQLQTTAYRGSAETIPRLSDFLAAIAGQVPLIIEIKSRFDGDMRLAERALDLVKTYQGPVCLKSFDPEILVFLRSKKSPCPLGLIAQAHYNDEDWAELAPSRRESLETLSDFPAMRPDFLSWRQNDLPAATPMLFRQGLGLPVMTWTIRSLVEQIRAETWADQIIFEGFAA